MGAFEKIPDKVKKTIVEGDADGHHRQSVAGGYASALSKEIYKFKVAEEKKKILEDASVHADRTRPGWDDDYSPSPNE